MLVIPLPLYVAMRMGGAIGAGDVKLLAASGLVLGLSYGMIALVIGSFCAALWAAGMLLRGAKPTDTFALGPFLSLGCALGSILGPYVLQMLVP